MVLIQQEEVIKPLLSDTDPPKKHLLREAWRLDFVKDYVHKEISWENPLDSFPVKCIALLLRLVEMLWISK